MRFNEKLKKIRKEQNLTQIELADKLFVSRSLVARWEYGDVYPTLDNLNKISSFFNISISELLCENEKTEIIVHHADLERKIKVGLRIFLLVLVISYSVVLPLLFCLKIFSLTAYDFSSDEDVLKVFHYSVLDSIKYEDSWLLVVSPLTNLILAIFAILSFVLKRKRLKNILVGITAILFVISLIFVILTFVLGTKNPLGILPKIM